MAKQPPPKTPLPHWGCHPLPLGAGQGPGWGGNGAGLELHSEMGGCGRERCRGPLPRPPSCPTCSSQGPISQVSQLGPASCSPSLVGTAPWWALWPSCPLRGQGPTPPKMLQGLRGPMPTGAGVGVGMERSIGWRMARKGAPKIEKKTNMGPAPPLHGLSSGLNPPLVFPYSSTQLQ